MMNMVEARQFNRKSGHFSVLSSVSGLALATALMWPGSPAQAACSPAAAAGTPSGGTVTCSATTNNQQGGGVGYGTGTQNNNTITITNNSGNITSTGTNTVNGSFALFALTNVTVSANTGTIAGVDVGITTTGTANITNNLGGTITGTGASSAGILAQGATTVN